MCQLDMGGVRRLWGGVWRSEVFCGVSVFFRETLRCLWGCWERGRGGGGRRKRGVWRCGVADPMILRGWVWRTPPIIRGCLACFSGSGGSGGACQRDVGRALKFVGCVSSWRVLGEVPPVEVSGAVLWGALGDPLGEFLGGVLWGIWSRLGVLWHPLGHNVNVIRMGVTHADGMY